MITLIRWYIMKTKEIKYKLAFWQFVDKVVKEIQKDPEWLAKNVMPELAKIIHESNQKES